MIFSITTPDHWSFRESAEIINKLQKLLELRSQADNVKEIKKRGNQIK